MKKKSFTHYYSLFKNVPYNSFVLSLMVLILFVFVSNKSIAQKHDYVIHIEEFELKTDGWNPYVEIWMGPFGKKYITPVGPNQVCNTIVIKDLAFTLGNMRLYLRVMHRRSFWWDKIILAPPHEVVGVFPATITHENEDVKIKVRITQRPSCTGQKWASDNKINEAKRMVTNPYALPGDLITTSLIVNVEETESPIPLQVYEQISPGFTYESSEPPAEVIVDEYYDDEDEIFFEITTLVWDFSADDFNDKELSYTIAAPYSSGSFYFSGYILLVDKKLNFTGETEVLILGEDVTVPTLTEWGVIILVLLILAVGMVFIYKRQASLAYAGGAVESARQTKTFLFDKHLFAKVFGITLIAGLAFLGLCYMIFGKITTADPLGTFVSAAIIAYMIQYMMLRRKQ